MTALNLDKLLEGDKKFREEDTREYIINRKLKKLFSASGRFGFKRYLSFTKARIAEILVSHGLVKDGSGAVSATQEVLTREYCTMPFIDGAFAWRFRRLANGNNNEAFQVENYYAWNCY